MDVVFSTPDKAPQLIDENGKAKGGTAYVDFGENVGDAKNEGWDIYKSDMRKKNKKYSEGEIQNQIDWWYGKGSFDIDWNLYETDNKYREKTNYYYFQAKKSLRDVKFDSKVDENRIMISYRVGQKGTGKMEMYKIPEDEAIYHNMDYRNGTYYFFMDGRNTKYVSNSGEEVILNKDNNAVYDPVAGSTYNFFSYPVGASLLNEDKRRHKEDIDLWKEYGTGPNDPTNKYVEKRREIGEIITRSFARDFQKNYYKIKEKAKKEKRSSYSYEEILDIMEKGDY